MDRAYDLVDEVSRIYEIHDEPVLMWDRGTIFIVGETPSKFWAASHRKTLEHPWDPWVKGGRPLKGTLGTGGHLGSNRLGVIVSTK